MQPTPRESATCCSVGTLRIAHPFVKPLRLNPQFLFIEIAMRYLGRITTPVESLVHRFRQHHGTVTSPRASKCYRQVALSLADIVRDQIDQQSFHAPQEFPGLRKRTDIARDERIA